MAYDFAENKTDWNMNEAWLMEEMRQFSRGHDQREVGNLFGWWNSLRSVYGMMYHDILQPGHEKEEEEVQILFNKVENLVTSNTPEAKKAAIKQLDKIELLLKDLVFRYKHVSLKNSKRYNPHKAIEEEAFE